jgi:hypothetical protein
MTIRTLEDIHSDPVFSKILLRPMRRMSHILPQSIEFLKSLSH